MKRARAASMVVLGSLVGSLLPSLLGGALAHANGRFPAASQLVEDQADDDHVFVQVT